MFRKLFFASLLSVLVLIICCFWLPLAAQETASERTAPAPPPAGQRQPRIGLALSGGGARGATHVGILKALEELNVPIYCITGTSMGSIVGGLYSIGMTPQEIEQLLTTADWETLFTDRPPRKDLPFRKKQDDQRYLPFELGVDKNGVKTGLGMVTGQHLNAFLETLTLRAGKTEDFTKLPIPFSCVGTDIVTGEKVVLSKGHLATAIRASMSIPTVFTPVEWDGHLLVDGGITDNLPVGVAKAMGADFVIAVDISTPPATREELTNFMSISGQMLSILMAKNVQDSAKEADIFIKPDLQGFSNMDFAAATKLIPIGYEAVMSRKDEFTRFSVPKADHDAELAKVRSHVPGLPEKLEFVDFEGKDEKSRELVLRKISSQPGQPFNPDIVSKDLDRIFAAGEFQSVSYTLAEREGKEGLVISAKPNDLGPNRIKFGMLLSTDFSKESNWAVLAQFRKTRINRLGAEWKSDMEIGLDRRLYSEFYQPLDWRAHWFIAPYIEYYNLRQDLYEQEEATATYRAVQADAGIDLGFNFSKYGELRIGLVRGKGKFENILGTDIFNKYGFADEAEIAAIRTRLTLDHLDSADFPTQGYLLDIDNAYTLDSLGSDDEYRRLELKYRGYGTWGKNTFLAGFVGGTAFGSELPPYAFFQAGGPSKFGGYDKGQLVGRYYGTVRLGYSRMVSQLPLMVGKGVQLSFFGDVGNVWLESRDISWDGRLYSGTIDACTNTSLGPIHLAFSRTSDGKSVITFYLGKKY